LGFRHDIISAWFIFQKDLKLESRQKFEFFSMIIFSISAVLIFSLAFDQTTLNESPKTMAKITGASLWIIFIFAGMLSFSSLFGREISSGGGSLIFLRSFPLKPQSLFIGKMIFNLILLFIVEIMITLLYMIFFQLEFKGSIFFIFIVLFIATSDYAVVGTLVSALAIYSRAKTLVIPLLVFPLIIPSVMLAVLLIANVIIGDITPAFYQNLLLLFLHLIITLMIAILTIETIIRD
jgi:heme exporter protein B